MANLTESATYDAGVYQLETTDPVQGGAAGKSNAAQINLANRTGWLKAAVDAINTAIGLLAPKASPTLTGTPLAPTPTSDDNSTKIATTAFVRAAIFGTMSKSVAGNSNVTLSAAEASAGILTFTGALTGNINVIVPGVAAKWVVRNSTSGAFSLTVKTAGGSGIAVVQGKSTPLLCDATNVEQQKTEFDSIAMTGTPTAPTAAPGTNTTQVASTAFVVAALAAAGGVTLGSTNGAALGAAAPGVAVTAARSDHVHPLPSAAALGVVNKAGDTMTGVLNLTNASMVSTNLGNISGAVTIDCSLGGIFYGTCIGSCSYTFTNMPATGHWGGADLELTNAGAFPQTFTGVKWPSGTQPTFTAAGVDCLTVTSRDGGTTKRGEIYAQDSK